MKNEKYVDADGQTPLRSLRSLCSLRSRLPLFFWRENAQTLSYVRVSLFVSRCLYLVIRDRYYDTVKFMLLTLDFESDLPIYQQIRQQVMLGVASGKLCPGESLPSVRQLAADIGVNLHTVNKAYQLLRDDGVVIIHRQRGVVVSENPQPRDSFEFFGSISERLEQLAAEAKALGMAKETFVSLAKVAWEDVASGKCER